MTRTHLVGAAAAIMRQKSEVGVLRVWADNLRERSNYRRVTTALARKLAVVMLSIWKSGQTFDPNPRDLDTIGKELRS